MPRLDHNTFFTESRTPQEVFDYVMTALARQGWLPSVDIGACAYRGDNGKMCAAGHCMPDVVYTDNIEGNGIRSESIAFQWEQHSPQTFKHVEPHLPLLSILQAYHDTKLTNEDYRRQLYQVHIQEVLTGRLQVSKLNIDARSREYYDNIAAQEKTDA